MSPCASARAPAPSSARARMAGGTLGAASVRDSAAQTVPAFAEVSPAPPELPECARELDAFSSPRRSYSKRSSAARRLSCSCASRSSQSACSAPDKSSPRLFREIQEVRRVPGGDVSPLSGLREPLERVLADRLQHAHARDRWPSSSTASRLCLASDSTSVEQVDGDNPARILVGADRLDGVEGGAAAKDAESGKKRLLRRFEEVVAPVDRGAERLLPCGEIARSAGEEGQARLQPCQELRGRQEPGARGGQLDGQRQPIQTAGRWRRRRRCSRAECEVGPHQLARSAKRRMASLSARCRTSRRLPPVDRRGRARGGTGNIRSPAIPSGARLVISMVSRWHAATRPRSVVAGVRTCSRLSSTRRVSRSCQVRDQRVQRRLVDRLAHAEDAGDRLRHEVADR